MIGAPINGVMALSGKMPCVPGNAQISWHNSATNEPNNMLIGSNCWWLSVDMSRRAKCGTARPINAIGPQYAVVTAVSHPVITNRQLRTVCTFIPKLCAYCSPSNNALRGFISNIAPTNPIIIVVVNNGS